jgi:8-oxoguanine deaminase
MSVILIENAHRLVTMDQQRREIEDGALVAENNKIVFVGSTLEVAKKCLPQH